MKLASIKQRLFATPLSAEWGYVPRKLSFREGDKLARDILDLLVEVMGGLS